MVAIDPLILEIRVLFRYAPMIGAQELESSRSERLRVDVQEQVERLNDLIASINEVYDYHRHGGGLS